MDKDTQAYVGSFNTINAKAQGAGLSGVYDGTIGASDFGVLPVNSFHGLAVQATSSEDVFGLAPAIGGGFVGVAGGVGVTLIDVTVKAFVAENTLVNDLAANSVAVGQRLGGRLREDADDRRRRRGRLRRRRGRRRHRRPRRDRPGLPRRRLDGERRRDVDVNALSHKDVATYALSIGGGFVGVAGSVSVWTVGTQTTTTYTEGSGAAPVDFVAGGDYNTDAVVHDTVDDKLYSPRSDICGVAGPHCPSPYTTAPHSDVYDPGTNPSGRWTLVQKSPLKGTPTEWVTGTSYHEGDIVKYNGQTYTATQDVTNTAQNPAANTSEWKQGGDAVQDADHVASGDGGYKSGLNGSSTRDAGTWTSGHVYEQGEVVTYLGNKYVAKNRIAHPTENPASNGFSEWNPYTASGGASMTSARISQYLSSGPNSATGKISASAPTSPTGTALGPQPLPLGTSAAINGTVVAGGAVSVRAKDDLELFGIAGSVAVGFVGVGAAVLVLSVETIADAGIGPNAVVSAGGGAGGSLSVEAKHTSDVFAIAFGGTGGVVAVGGQVVVVNDTSRQKAHVETGAKLPRAGGGITVSARAERDEYTLAIGVGLGLVAAGAAISILNEHGDTEATVGNVPIGSDAAGTGIVSGPVKGLSVTAYADASPRADAYSVQAGVGGSLSGAVAFATLDGTTKAQSGAHGPLTTGDFLVTATGLHGGTKAQTFNVGTGAVAGGLTIARAEDDRATTATMTGGSIGTSGEVRVEADATNVAVATAPGVSVGLVALSVMLPTAIVSGDTTAQLNGTITGSSMVHVHAIAENRAKADAKILNVSLGGLSGAFAERRGHERRERRGEDRRRRRRSRRAASSRSRPS